MMRNILTLTTMFICVLAIQADIVRSSVEYAEGETELEGVWYHDQSLEGPLPAVLVYHAWGGPGDYEERRARQLAELGYAAFVADIYGKGVRPESRQERAAEAGKYRADRELMRARARAAFDLLAADERVDADRIAAIGYCFGGGVALELARSGAPLAGAVSFHGNLATPDPSDARNIQGRVLVLHGADDPFVPDEEVLAFQEEMREAGVDWQLIAYGGAVHSFTHREAGDDPSTGAAYHEPSDRRSWQAMKQFLQEVFE